MLMEKSCIASLTISQQSRRSLCISFAFFSFGGELLSSLIGPTNFWNWPNRFGGTGLTSLGNLFDRYLVLAHVQGECAYVQGELLYALVVCAPCLSLFLTRLC
jgi:hypothetical protein